MKTTLFNTVCIGLMGCATAAFAATGAERDGGSLMLILFLAFGALIIVFQLFPGSMLFVSMLKGLFSPSRETAATTADKADRAS